MKLRSLFIFLLKKKRFFFSKIRCGKLQIRIPVEMLPSQNFRIRLSFTLIYFAPINNSGLCMNITSKAYENTSRPTLFYGWGEIYAICSKIIISVLTVNFKSRTAIFLNIKFHFNAYFRTTFRVKMVGI